MYRWHWGLWFHFTSVVLQEAAPPVPAGGLCLVQCPPWGSSPAPKLAEPQPAAGQELRVAGAQGTRLPRAGIWGLGPCFCTECCTSTRPCQQPAHQEILLPHASAPLPPLPGMLMGNLKPGVCSPTCCWGWWRGAVQRPTGAREKPWRWMKMWPNLSSRQPPLKSARLCSIIKYHHSHYFTILLSPPCKRRLLSGCQAALFCACNTTLREQKSIAAVAPSPVRSWLCFRRIRASEVQPWQTEHCSTVLQAGVINKQAHGKHIDFPDLIAQQPVLSYQATLICNLLQEGRARLRVSEIFTVESTGRLNA